MLLPPAGHKMDGTDDRSDDITKGDCCLWDKDFKSWMSCNREKKKKERFRRSNKRCTAAWPFPRYDLDCRYRIREGNRRWLQLTASLTKSAPGTYQKREDGFTIVLESLLCFCCSASLQS